MTAPTYDAKAAMARLSDKNTWGDQALPPLTLSQAALLYDALIDAYSVGYMRAEKESAWRKISRNHPGGV